MNAPVPKALIDGVVSTSVLELAERCGRAVQEVEGYLRSNDLDGADQYLEDFCRTSGVRAHNTVMKMLAEIYGSPDWRTFS